MYKVAVIVGSARRESLNRKFAAALMQLGHPKLQFSMLQIDDLPMFNQDHEKDPGPQVTRYKNELKAADAFVFVSPEYNRSIPALLKNAIDWGTRPYGQNAWGLKPGAIAGITFGTSGTIAAQQHLRQILSAAQVALLSQPEVYVTWKEGMIDSAGNFTDETFRKFLEGFLDKFAGWVAQLTKSG